MINIKPQNGSTASGIIPALIFSFFLCFTIYVGLKGIGLLMAPDKAENWVKSQASVLSSKLETIHSTDHEGNVDTSYLASGSFSYTWEGVEYISEQLFFSKKPDGIGTYHHDIRDLLSKHISDKSSIDIWVNPKDPSEAVMFNEIRWGLFYFYMMFPIWGFVFSFFYFYGRAKRKKNAESLIRSDLEDLSNNDTKDKQNSRTISSNLNKYLLWTNKTSAVTIGLMTILISQMMIFWIFVEKNHNLYFLILLPFIGTIVTIYLYRRYLQNLKFAKSKLIVNDIPVCIGGNFSGAICLPTKLEPGLVYKVKLELIEQNLHSETPENEETNPQMIKWKDTQKLKPKYNSKSEGSTIPFLFKLPDSIAINNLTRNSEAYYWRLTAKADNRGINLNVNFKFTISESLPEGLEYINANENKNNKKNVFSQFHNLNIENNKETIEEDSTNIYIDKGSWRKTRAQYSKFNGKHTYIFPPFRNLKLLVFSIVLTLLFTLIAAHIFIINDDIVLKIFFGIIFLSLSIITFFGMLDSLFYKSKLTVSYDELITHSNYPLKKTHKMKRRDVKKFSKQAIGGGGDEFYYNLYIEKNNGKRITVAKYIKEGRDLDSLYSKIKREFWLPEDQIT